MRTRLTGKARLGLPDNIADINDLKQNVKQRCASKVTPDNISAKLKAVKQKGSVVTFCEEVDSLTSKLQAAYLQNAIPETVANSMATKVGIDTLINGINSQETKIILKAGTFSDIKSATQKVLENAGATSQQTQVFSFNTRYEGKRYEGNRSGFRNFRGNPRNQHSSSSYQQQNNRYRDTHQRQPQFNQQQHFNNNYNNNRGQRGRQKYQQRHMYTTNAQQTQTMQTPMPFNMPMAMVTSMPSGTMMPHNIHFLDHPGQVMTP